MDQTQSVTPISKSEEIIMKMKSLGVVQNAHNIIPPQKDTQDISPVAIVSALHGEQYVQKLIMQLKGMIYNPLTKGWEGYRKPVMNEAGIGKFIYVISNIAEVIEYSHYHEDEIPKNCVFNFESNYPYFTLYFDEYDLDKSDFNLISTLLFNFIYSSLLKAKGAGHRNVVRGTYSEDMMGKALGVNTPAKKSGWKEALSELNPLRRG